MSDCRGIIECMFESRIPSPESVARLDAILGVIPAAPQSAALVDLARPAGGEQSRGRWLDAANGLRRFGERETWCTDTQEAVAAEVAAALSITRGWRPAIWSTPGRCDSGCRR